MAMDNAIHDAKRLKELQALPLERKIMITQTRIIEWYQHYNGNVVVSFSGGKDSTVLLHIARQLYPNIPAVFSNTGLEYPEIQSFVRKHENVEIVRPKMQFSEVISKYGYPLIGKEVSLVIYNARSLNKSPKFQRSRLLGTGITTLFDHKKWLPLARDLPVLISGKCCLRMKKDPMHKYQTSHGLSPILATLAEESLVRKQAWVKHGCNAFDGSNPKSQPMSFWTEQDVLAYLVKYDVPIASVYGEIVAFDEEGNEYNPKNTLTDCKLKCTGCERTGCIFCAFGFHNEKGETRFQRLAKTHPHQYEYCMGGGQWVDNPHYDPTAPEYDGEWKNWNPPKIWVPSKQGLGMGKVFDMVNEIYGKDFYRYE